MSGSVADTRYLFSRSERSIFSEIYFPKRAAYQGTIFNALRYGHDEDWVKRYLREQVQALLNEFHVHPIIFDPDNYSTARGQRPPSLERAMERIDMYLSPFKGWSTYSVDGVFFDRYGKMYEEATQVVRIMFRFPNSYLDHAVKASCQDVLRVILYWVIEQGRLDDQPSWSEAEKSRFMLRHEPWPAEKQDFAERHFTDIAKEVAKWIDDRTLFIYGYLVRQFSGQVLTENLYEEEIWVTSFFNQALNVISRVDKST